MTASPEATVSTRPASLRRRAAVAVALLVGFYVLAFAVVAAIVLIEVALLVFAERIFIQLVVAGVLIVVAIVRGAFRLRGGGEDPTGVAVTRSDEPNLWALAERTAAAVGTRPPADLILIPEVNAFVHERTKLLGLVPGRRLLAVGLPLVDALSARELEAVVAHEMGHYAGGDTRLSALVYRASASIEQTLDHLGGGAIHALFAWYARLYWRITLEVRRAQELEADRQAARLAGSRALTAALRTSAVLGALYPGFLRLYVAPAVRAGRRPASLFSGFRAFAASREEDALAALDEAASVPTSPFDSHPSLRDRLARLPPTPDADGSAADEPAGDLLRRRDVIEERLSRLVVGRDELAELSWDAFAADVVTPAELDAGRRVLSICSAMSGGAASLSSVLELLAASPEPVAAALAGGPYQLPIARRDEAVRAHVKGAAAVVIGFAAVTQAVARWQLRWSRPASLVTASGVELPVDEWAESVAAGAVDEVARGVAAAGIDVARPLGARVPSPPLPPPPLPPPPLPPPPLPPPPPYAPSAQPASASPSAPPGAGSYVTVQPAVGRRAPGVIAIVVWSVLAVVSAVLVLGGLLLIVAPDVPDDRSSGVAVLVVFGPVLLLAVAMAIRGLVLRLNAPRR